jgi:DNA segregation ATPase FtsK/SpoIIIE-like protein
MAEQINEKQFRVMELNDEIRSYTSTRKGEIKTLEEDLAPLVRRFHNKTESVEAEVRLITDFEAGLVRIESLDGELISEDEMPANGYQREFAVIMETEPGTSLIEKASAVLEAYLDEERPDDEVVTEGMLESALMVEPLKLSGSMAGRVVAMLRDKEIIQGRGYAGYEFSFCNVAEEAEIKKEQSEEIGEEQILEAVRTISETMRASTSILQRKMKVGYNRAARLMDLLEQRAVIGPVVENTPREILMNLEQYQEVLEQSIGGEK